jgi:TonB family protein
VALTGGNQDKLPPQFRFDTAPHVIGATLPVYPYEEYVARRKGSATVLLLIDPQGKVAQTKILAASSPAFGFALAAAAEESAFTPALKDGHATATIIKRQQDFDPDSQDLLTTDRDWRILRQIQKNPKTLTSAASLDHPLKPASARMPVTPSGHRHKNDHGSALIEIVIDQDGTVVLPQIIKASAPEYGYAAVQAVKQWQFDIPTVGGKPVLVWVSVPFNFDVGP